MSHPNDQLAQNYTAAFVGYLSQRGEATLRAAYELGRAALADAVCRTNKTSFRPPRSSLSKYLRPTRWPGEASWRLRRPQR